ncbi:MAG: hypothetical protein IJZ74_11250 [Clostridia bacterium]|nr:hypothetical protein [Clostridia bacterium]
MKKLISILLPLMLVGTAFAEEAAVTSSLAGASLLTKGLIVTAGGLLGVFLVLILFFLTIKLMQKVLK